MYPRPSGFWGQVSSVSVFCQSFRALLRESSQVNVEGYSYMAPNAFVIGISGPIEGVALDSVPSYTRLAVRVS